MNKQIEDIFILDHPLIFCPPLLPIIVLILLVILFLLIIILVNIINIIIPYKKKDG